MDYSSNDYLYNAQADFSGVNMPFSLEAEQSVLGAILLDATNSEASCIGEVAEILPRAECFYAVNNQLIYGIMLEMYTLGQPLDFVTLLEKLKENEAFDETTGKVYLTQLAQTVPSIANVEAYARIVRDKYDTRRLMQVARGILDEANEGSTEPGMLLDSAEQRIFEIRQGTEVDGLRRINEVLLETYDRLNKLNSPDRDKYRGLPTGIGELDSVITGLNRSDLVILAARPGMGKTSFALNIARHIAVTAKRRVAFFSLEMGKEQLASRLLSSEARVEGTKLRTGDLSEDEWTKLIEAGDILRGAELYLDDTPGITVPKIKTRVRRLKNVDLIVVDYLQLMSSGSTRRIENRVNEVSDITRNFKIMAKELNVPVLVLSQLARASEKRTDHRPVLSDLRDSGSIEQDADVVLMLYRDEYYKGSDAPVDENADRNSCECIIAKNRHGETKTVNMHWQGEFMRFTSREVIRHG